MPNVHPLIVHFPIALLSAAALFECLARWRKSDGLSSAGWWTQCLGTLGLGAAALSGLRAGESVHIAGASVSMWTTHQELAFVSTALFAILLFWRIGARMRIPTGHPFLYLAGMCVAVALLWGTAWFGGEMVYRLGVGVGSGGGVLH